MGDLKVVARADLGGLGDVEGTPVAYAYAPVNVWPRLLPWAAMLGLLLPARNRVGKAWWIWLPLLFWSLLTPLALSWFWGMPSQVRSLFGPAVVSLAFGLAALWLLAPAISSSHRFLVFLGTLSLLTAGSGLAYVCLADWGHGTESWLFLLILGFAVLVTSLGLTLAGWKCGPGWSGLRFTGYFLLGVVAGWLAIVLPFALVAGVARGNGPELTEFVATWLGFSLSTFLVAWPFVILTYANGFYRQRLARLFLVPPATQPSPPG